MFGKFLKKEKPRVLLGKVTVVPRKSLKKIDEWGLFSSEDLNTSLYRSLTEIFSFPSASNVPDPESTDLVLDVAIPKYQSGDYWGVDFGEMGGAPFFWRPKIEVHTKLYELSTNKTKSTFSITEKMRWSAYIPRIFSLRALIRFSPVFDKSDMDLLLCQACIKVLEKVKKEM